VPADRAVSIPLAAETGRKALSCAEIPAGPGAIAARGPPVPEAIVLADGFGATPFIARDGAEQSD